MSLSSGDFFYEIIRNVANALNVTIFTLFSQLFFKLHFANKNILK